MATAVRPREDSSRDREVDGELKQRVKNPATSSKKRAERNSEGTDGRSRATTGAGSTAERAGKALAVVTRGSPTAMLARRATLAVARTISRQALQSRSRIALDVVSQVRDQGQHMLRHGLHSRLPIQCSVDVAVPLPVVWAEWIKLGVLPEGAHRVKDIERDRDMLNGRIEPGGEAWSAKVLDEREQQSFAWLSVEGSDCSGLITFHRLSARLTRLELMLDVVPASVGEGIVLSAHIAERRAERELRAFKARLELINPDLYEDNDPDG